MYCPYCGKQVEDTTSFCPYCGEHVAEDEPEHSSVQTPAPSPDEAKADSKCDVSPQGSNETYGGTQTTNQKEGLASDTTEGKSCPKAADIPSFTETEAAENVAQADTTHRISMPKQAEEDVVPINTNPVSGTKPAKKKNSKAIISVVALLLIAVFVGGFTLFKDKLPFGNTEIVNLSTSNLQKIVELGDSLFTIKGNTIVDLSNKDKDGAPIVVFDAQAKDDLSNLQAHDGKLWFAQDKDVYNLDLDTKETKTVATLDEEPEKMIVAQDKIYTQQNHNVGYIDVADGVATGDYKEVYTSDSGDIEFNVNEEHVTITNTSDDSIHVEVINPEDATSENVVDIENAHDTCVGQNEIVYVKDENDASTIYISNLDDKTEKAIIIADDIDNIKPIYNEDKIESIYFTCDQDGKQHLVHVSSEGEVISNNEIDGSGDLSVIGDTCYIEASNGEITQLTDEGTAETIVEAVNIPEKFDGAGNTAANYASGSCVAFDDEKTIISTTRTPFPPSGAGWAAALYNAEIMQVDKQGNTSSLNQDMGSFIDLSLYKDKAIYNYRAKFAQCVHIGDKELFKLDYFSNVDGPSQGDAYIGNMSIVGDTLFYRKSFFTSDMQQQTYKTYKANPDGSDEKKLFDSDYQILPSANGAIAVEYTAKPFNPEAPGAATAKVYSMSLDTYELTEIYDSKDTNLACVQPYKDHIYGIENTNTVICLDMDGTNKQEIAKSNGGINSLNVTHNIAFYLDEGTFYGTNLTTGDVTAISKLPKEAGLYCGLGSDKDKVYLVPGGCACIPFDIATVQDNIDKKITEVTKDSYESYGLTLYKGTYHSSDPITNTNSSWLPKNTGLYDLMFTDLAEGIEFSDSQDIPFLTDSLSQEKLKTNCILIPGYTVRDDTYNGKEVVIAIHPWANRKYQQDNLNPFIESFCPLIIEQ